MRFACGIPVALVFTAGVSAAQSSPREAAVDSFVTAQMTRRAIPGLSLAIIDGGRIVYSKGYGVAEVGSATPVTTSTLFQAGSISKSVAAFGALRLVEQGKLSLDTDVNATLKSWKLPASSLAASKPVTLRGLLSHSAGLTVHGFPGYAMGGPLPTLVQVLDGAQPANTPPIRVDLEPGSTWRYSGGGYTVMQQMMLDVTGQTFPDYMRSVVIEPVGMSASSFEQPLPTTLAAKTATGHSNQRLAVPGRWHVYPEMAAAGLWTTPTDLARFAIEVQQAYAGKSSRVISPGMARQMLTDQKNSDGLGVFLHGSGRTLLFEHGGRDEGFDASMNALAESGQGAVVMINTNDNSPMVGRIVEFIARQYAWPTATKAASPVPEEVQRSADQLRPYVGRYELSNNNMISFDLVGKRLFSISDRFPDEEFIAVGDGRFASADNDSRLTFSRNATGAVTGITWTRDGKDRSIPRIGPPFTKLARSVDPDTAFTRKLEGTLRTLAKGGLEVAGAPQLTAGAQRDFSRAGPWPTVVGLRSISFVAEERVAGRGLERHDNAVDRIRYYAVTTDGGVRSLLVWMTKDGLITDFDQVSD
ncbi:MAG: serine hydrolase [Gemmatimonadaceae bacterium]